MAAGALRRRTLQRRVHLAGTVLLLVYVYAPFGDAVESLVRFVVFPLAALSGVAMWQGPRLLRRLRKRG